MIYTVPIGEPFKSALDNNRPADVADSACQSPADLYARGVARTAIGRFDDARVDLVSACREAGPLERRAGSSWPSSTFARLAQAASVARNRTADCRHCPARFEAGRPRPPPRRTGRLQSRQRRAGRRSTPGGGSYLPGDRLRERTGPSPRYAGNGRRRGAVRRRRASLRPVAGRQDNPERYGGDRHLTGKSGARAAAGRPVRAGHRVLSRRLADR